ncbi:MAG: hypothetical protein ACRDYX_11380 [Egibacteraceae bacterium]
MQRNQTTEKSDRVIPAPVGAWLRAVTTADGTCSSATPCCDAPVEVPLADLEVLGEVELRCPTPTCRKRWDLRYDPWTPGRDALWID